MAFSPLIGPHVRAERLNIYVPYTQVLPGTMSGLLYYLRDTVFVDCRDDVWAYAKYMRRAWTDGARLINVEHDVFWAPGMLDEMWRCEHDWCVCPYSGPPDPLGAPPFGLVKFSELLIRQTENVWVDWMGEHGEQWRSYRPGWTTTAYIKPYYGLDCYLHDWIREQGVEQRHHSHFPHSINTSIEGHKPSEVYHPVRVLRDGAIVDGPKTFDITAVNTL
jgi:hypothetical protein